MEASPNISRCFSPAPRKVAGRRSVAGIEAAIEFVDVEDVVAWLKKAPLQDVATISKAATGILVLAGTHLGRLPKAPPNAPPTLSVSE